MALINCPECETQISDRATQCIKCGCPLNKSEDITNPLDHKPSDFDSCLETEEKESDSTEIERTYFDGIKLALRPVADITSVIGILLLLIAPHLNVDRQLWVMAIMAAIGGIFCFAGCFHKKGRFLSTLGMILFIVYAMEIYKTYMNLMSLSN